MKTSDRIQCLVAGICLLFAAGCRPSPLPPDELSAEQSATLTEKGAAVSTALMESLSTQLKAAMTSGGPVAAVSVCQQVAMPLTDSTAAQFDGVSVRRTALKVRNPANAPDATDLRVLNDWQRQTSEGAALPEHELVRIDASTARYYRPIIVQAVCLNCHGDKSQFSPELRDLLDSLYPDDKATGYAEGDLRGAIRVTIATSDKSD